MLNLLTPARGRCYTYFTNLLSFTHKSERDLYLSMTNRERFKYGKQQDSYLPLGILAGFTCDICQRNALTNPGLAPAIRVPLPSNTVLQQNPQQCCC